MTNVTLHVTAQPTRVHTEISSAGLNVKLEPTSLVSKSHSIPDYVALISPTDVSNLQLWLDPGQINTLYTDTSGTLGVTASDDPVGYATDKSLNQDAVAVSDSTRPTYKDVFQGKFLYHDTDDQLTVPNFPAAEYTAVAAYYGGTQAWQFTHSGGTLDINFGDYYELIIYTGTLSASDEADLLDYLEGNLPATPASEIWRFWVNRPVFSLALEGTGFAYWRTGDMQSGTGNYFSRTVTPPETISLRATAPENISSIVFEGDEILGTFPTLPENIEYCSFSNNNLSGNIPDLSEYSSLKSLVLHHNNFVGSVPSLPTSIETANFYKNSLAGSVPDMSGYPNLQSMSLGENFFTDYDRCGFHTSITSLIIYLNNNYLTTNAVDAILIDCYYSGVYDGYCSLEGGANSPPSFLGDIYSGFLITRGWTVYTN